MDILDRNLSAFPKGELSGRADRKIKNRLYWEIQLNKIKQIYSLNTYRAVFSHRGVAIAFMFVIIFGSTSIYAYASPNVIPGNQLYPLKLVIENIEQKVTVKTTVKISNYEKLSNRRLQEAVALQNKIATSSVAKVAVSDSIKNNINSEVSNHLAVVNSINSLVDSVQTNDVIKQAKQNDLMEIGYLNKIAQAAIARGDSEVVSKVDEAKAIIGNQQYREERQATSSQEIKHGADKKSPSYKDYIKNKPAYRADKNSTTTATSTAPVSATSTESTATSTQNVQNSNSDNKNSVNEPQKTETGQQATSTNAVEPVQNSDKPNNTDHNKHEIEKNDRK